MNAVRIRRMLESETLHLPELKPLVGKSVEIIVLEEPTFAITPGTGDWDAAERAVRELDNYDYDALRELDECDRLHANDHLPQSSLTQACSSTTSARATQS